MALESEEVFTRPSRSPPHLFRPNACYFISSKTLHGVPLLTDPRKQQTIDALRFACERRGWLVIAWVVLANHYHCLLRAPEEASELSELLRSIHRFTSNQWNREDNCFGRQVWYRYWDSCIDRERSFWARVNYIHYNPVSTTWLRIPPNTRSPATSTGPKRQRLGNWREPTLGTRSTLSRERRLKRVLSTAVGIQASFGP